jgi:ABC-type transport system substrate-binding protein
VTLNDKYWGKKPTYDTVVFRSVPEAATRESLLLAGQVDLIVLPPIADVPALQKNPAVKVLLAQSDRTIFISFNTSKPLLNDVRIRQALNYAVDKKAIIQNVLFGAADAIDAPMASSLFGYCKAGSYEYNPAKAKQLLTEAGVKPGTKIPFHHPTGRYVQDKEAAQAVAGYLREVGIEPELQTMDWPSYIAIINAGPAEKTVHHLAYLGWAPAFLDAAQQVLQYCQATIRRPGSPSRSTRTPRSMNGSRPRTANRTRTSGRNSTARSRSRSGRTRPGSSCTSSGSRSSTRRR